MLGLIKLYAQAAVNRWIFGKKAQTGGGALIAGRGGEITDGVTYAMPQLLPGYVRDALRDQGLLESYLQESARDSFAFPFDPPSVRDANFVGVYEDSLMEWDNSIRIYVLSNTHAAYARNPLAKRCVHYISAFVVGKGFNLHCKNKEVEAILQEFIDNPDNQFRKYERDAIRDLVVDGELFLRFFVGTKAQGGEVVAVPMRPWEIQYIDTEDGFFKRVKSYHYQPYGNHNPSNPNAPAPAEAKDIPGEEMIHVAINKHSYELRGRPELYPALPWLKAHKDWLENRARQNFFRGAMLWWFKIKNAIPAVIAAKVAQYSRPITPGSAAVTSDNEEITALTNPVGANDAGEDGRQLKIMAQNGIGGIPEYMTGDGQNANLATTTSQQLPVMTTFTEFQTIMVEEVLYPTFKRVLQAKIDAGLLDEEVEEQDSEGDPLMEEAEEENESPELQQPPTLPEDAEGEQEQDPARPKPKIKAIDAFDVDYEPIQDSAPNVLAQALAIALDHELISQQTATTEMGFDYTIEQKRINAEKQARIRRQASGQEPLQPGQFPVGYRDEDEESEDGRGNEEGNPFKRRSEGGEGGKDRPAASV